ncbi:MAG: LysR family transcriptional regulator [Oscillospiraceae bacterium]|nr:LysR family transcriptional regulator [Oscillospiraceae bacterium]
MRKSQLEFFVSAARNLSFTKAAKECYTVQSAISQQITALEEELGFPLFDRTGNGIRLTPAGERYYSDTQLILKKLEENQQIAQQIAHGISGHLKVGLAGANQAAYMGSLKRFVQRNPEVRVSFCEVSAENQVEELRNRVYDILFTATFNMHGFENEIGFAERHVNVLDVYMNEDHPLARQENITLEELSQWPNIYSGVPENGKRKSTEKDLYAGTGLKPIRTIYVSNHNISTLLLDLNSGVAVAPRELLPSMPKKVLSRPLEHDRFRIELAWAYFRENMNPALLRFLNDMDHQNS